MGLRAVAAARPVPYALILDLPAGSEHYERLSAAFANAVPEGLLLHAAGPTMEGFRTIDVWESEEAWRRFRRERLNLRFDDVPRLVRELHVQELISQPSGAGAQEIADLEQQIGALQRVIAAARLVS